MSLNDLFCAALETGLNKLQELDGSSKKQRKKLAERVIAITFKEFNKSLYFVISEQQIDILSSFDGSTDCTIQLSVFALNDLKNNQKLTMLIREGQLDVIGDIQLAQQFAQLITTMDIDWEALLANKIGDVLAHKLCYLVSKGHQQINRQLQQKTTQRVALILAEKNIAPIALEVAFFCDEVSEVDQQLSALDARFNNLYTQLTLAINR